MPSARSWVKVAVVALSPEPGQVHFHHHMPLPTPQACICSPSDSRAPGTMWGRVSCSRGGGAGFSKSSGFLMSERLHLLGACHLLLSICPDSPGL